MIEGVGGLRVWVAKAILVLLATLAGAGPDSRTNEAEIVVRDTAGKAVRPLARDLRKATLLIFIAHDCPISNALAREAGRICRKYEKQGIRSYVVYVEQDLKPADARKHWKEFGYPCPGLLDPKRLLVRHSGATKTPEAALIGRDGKTHYRGRIDDTFYDYGKRRDEPRSRDLRRAIDAFLAKKPVSPSVTPVVGCYIPDL